MAKTNVTRKPEKVFTHPGANAVKVNAELQLRRSVMSCLLWEDEFYEDGVEISTRISDLIPKVKPEKVMAIAIEARNEMKLRHIPLFIIRCMARLPEHKRYVAKALEAVIQRADELAEFVAIYWKDGKQPLSAQVKKGLANAFLKFNEYQLAKYDRSKSNIRLRDVAMLCHVNPGKDKVKGKLFADLINRSFYPAETKSGFPVKKEFKLKKFTGLATPDTWEVNLSAGKNKKETFERLISEKKLGALALLRNLRNMENAGVDPFLVTKALMETDMSKVLPFRFFTAAKAVPKWEDKIEPAMFKCLNSQKKLPGKTILIVDVSGSMFGSSISRYSEMTREKVAASLGILIRELCEEPVIYATAGNDGRGIHATDLVPPRRGFALADAILKMTTPLGGGGIFLKQVMDYVYKKEKKADRIIVITDEQDCSYGGEDAPTKANTFGTVNYLINIQSNHHGIGYGKWVHLDGWSESVVNFIQAYENELQ